MLFIPVRITALITIDKILIPLIPLTIIRNSIKNMKIDNQNETILVKIIEDICDKLDKTIYSSFKKVAVNEFDRFLKISTVEKQKILKK